MIRKQKQQIDVDRLEGINLHAWQYSVDETNFKYTEVHNCAC